MVNDAPDIIYLQIGPDSDDAVFHDLGEITWCRDKIFDTDIKYVRVRAPSSGVACPVCNYELRGITIYGRTLGELKRVIDRYELEKEG